MGAPKYTLVVSVSATALWDEEATVKDNDDRDLRHWVHRGLNNIAAKHRAAMEADAKNFMSIAESCWP